MGLDGIYRKTVPLNVHLIESNAGHHGVTAGETAPATPFQFATMNILELSISNVKRITALELSTDGVTPVVLTGDNAQGKSSVLDSILLTLQNTGLAQPIHRGTDKAEVQMKLGTNGETLYSLEKVITEKGNYLRIKGADGKQVPTPQRFIDSLVGNLAFDPLAFATLKEKEQAETIRAALGLDFSKLDAERKAVYDTRRDVNRDVDQFEKQLAGLAVPPNDTPSEAVSVSELIAQRDGMLTKVSQADKANQALTSLQQRLAREQAEVQRAKQALELALSAVNKTESEITGAEMHLADVQEQEPTPLAIDAVSQQINSAEQINANVRLKTQRAEIKAKLDKLNKESKALTSQIEGIDASKAKQLAEAPFPVPGMTFADDGSVQFNGLPFTQMSTAEQIRISTLVAMAQNPKLKVILIREGALVNKANMKVLTDLAASGGYQLWIERFSETPGEDSLHITDGHISHVNGKPV